LRRFLDLSWQLVDRCPLLLDPILALTLVPTVVTPTGQSPARSNGSSGEVNAPAPSI
jgi:hypothetical protein